MIFKKLLTALITPFQDDKIDFAALQILVQNQIDAGVQGIVIGGSTGEGSLITEEEYHALISTVINYAQGKIKVIASVAGASTLSVCKKIEQFSKMNIDGLMCTAPYYVRPEQDGLYQHFASASAATDLPIMIYIHPGRTGCSMSDDTIIRLAEIENIKALKDATDDIEKPLRLIPNIKNGFGFLAGDDSRCLAYSANGGVGLVSVIANAFPKIYVAIVDYCLANDFSKARTLQQMVMPLINAIFAESNPIGIKYACSLLKICEGSVRSPLTKASSNTQEKIRNLINKIQILEKNV